MSKKVVTFPLKLSPEFSREIDKVVFELNENEEVSKQRFCLEAIREKVEEFKESKGEN